MAATPALTVVIPTYQRAATVARAVGSVLAQTGCPPFEVVVVDDGSTDDTPAVLGGIDDPRVRVIRQDNAGRGAARNAGVVAARSPIVTFLDSDDEALPGWLAEVARQVDPDRVPMVRMGVLRARPGQDPEESRGAPLRPERPLPSGATQPGSLALTRDLFLRVGGFDPALEFSENTDLLVRLALASRREGWTAAWTEACGVVLHEEPTGDRTNRYGSAPAQAARVMLARYPREFRRDRRARRDYLAVVGTGELRSGHRLAAARAFWRSWCARPLSLRSAARLASVVLPMTRPRNSSSP
jgi:glycosyltransferase involved in cell wall biosynthesis